MRINHDRFFMNPAQVRECVEQLAAEFNVPVPVVSWSARTKRGRYMSAQQRISIGPSWRGVEPSVLHEFAHHLEQVNGHYKPTPEQKMYARRAVHHGPSFWQALRDVAAAWYGDASKYPWGTEYKTGQVFGRALRVK